MTTPSTYTPGTLIRARGRDWVAEADSTETCLHLRPLAGDSSASAWIIPSLEIEPPTAAVFPEPDTRPDRLGNLSEIRLVNDAMRMRMRAGAGPFRSFGRISVEPRAYQLVPLMMALRQSVIRMLIADDVGIGKTIEAGLILRELLDRGEITRASILCPPNLVDQWQSELQRHFNIPSVVVTSSSIRKLERDLPPGASVFEYHAVTIISLDYIKREEHIQTFLAGNPPFLIVDEAHTCTSVGRGFQQRYQMLRQLADAPDRHLVMLTATPHSGIESGFYNLLGLLHKDFAELGEVSGKRRENLRARLADYLIQRRRQDVVALSGTFPEKESMELTYALSGPWGSFFNEAKDYCVSLAERSASNRMIWYAVIALMRCISSSPAAAVSAIQARLQKVAPDDDKAFRDITGELVESDVDDESASSDDVELPAPADDSDLAKLKALLKQAETIRDSGKDSKLQSLIPALRTLTSDGYSPIIFCQYISTAHYVAEVLQKEFPGFEVQAVTGRLMPSEREFAIDELGKHEKRILVATNCLSEGINLQEHFNAVVHYDLAWNPTRHEQREGRVDRFGQQSPKVRSIMFYSNNNPVDGLILSVILRKAKTIRDELGVNVPVPMEEGAMTDAIVKAALLSPTAGAQIKTSYLPGFEEEIAKLDLKWKAATDKARATVFAQRTIGPQEVMAEIGKQQKLLLNDEAATLRFLKAATQKLGAPISEAHGRYSFTPANFADPTVARIMREYGISGTFKFAMQPGRKAEVVTRTHPVVAALADYCAEKALDDAPSARIPRAAVVLVDPKRLPGGAVMLVYLVRIRYDIATNFDKKRRPDHTMAEELVTLVRHGKGQLEFATEAEVEALATVTAAANPPAALASKLQEAIPFWHDSEARITQLARQRADQLLQDHRHVRSAARMEAGSVSVTPYFPVDLLTVTLLVPSF